MYIVKVLKRKDAASVIVAIVLATAFSQGTFLAINQWAYKVSQLGAPKGNNNYGGYMGGWRDTYVNPLVQFLLVVIVLEVFIRLFVWLHPMFVNKKK